MTTQQPRIDFIDIAKGIAIILVVYGHCLRGLASANVVSTNSWLIITDYTIYTFHMPVFFMLSGIFFKSSLSKSRGFFWIKRFKTIVYPYFFWSLFQGSIQIMLSGSGAVNNQMGIGRLYNIFLDPISPFWFLYALFFCNILAYFSINLRIKIQLTSAFIAYISSFFIAPSVIADIFYGFFYFTLGMAAYQYNLLSLITPSWGSVVKLSSIFFALSFCFYYISLPVRLSFPAGLLGIASTLVFCATLEKIPRAASIPGFLKLVGQCSMSIYVMHIIFLGFVRTVLLRFFHINNLAVLISSAIICAVLLPMIVQLFAIKLKINDIVALPSSTNLKVKHNQPQ